MLPQLARYTPVPPDHPWFAAEQQRQLGVQHWAAGQIEKAHAVFAAGIRQSPEFPFAWSTYHRFLHAMNGQAELPRDGTVVIPQTSLFSPFLIYRFFGRCQVAAAVAARGWAGFEPPCPLVLVRWLRRVGGTFCDIGANSGYYSLLALAAGTRDVIAFEPFAAAADVLLSNLELNGWGPRVNIQQCAADRRQGTTRFYLPPQSHGLLETSASQDPAFHRQHSFEFDVDSITLDSLLNDAAIPDAMTIKVDVEGVEPTSAVLRGARQLIRHKRPVMMVEYLRGPGDALNAFLADSSYTSFFVRPDGTLLVETRMTPQPDQLNHFLVPRELSQGFLNAVCDR
jgi:FkbM family methyltransferase